jgi:hypothetical protein
MAVWLPLLSDTDLRKYAHALQQLARGGSNATGSFTLTASTTMTTVSAPTCAVGSGVFWQPMTANAAAQMATLYCTGGSTGGFSLHHASNVTTDATFFYEVRG